MKSQGKLAVTSWTITQGVLLSWRYFGIYELRNVNFQGYFADFRSSEVIPKGMFLIFWAGKYLGVCVDICYTFQID